MILYVNRFNGTKTLLGDNVVPSPIVPATDSDGLKYISLLILELFNLVDLEFIKIFLDVLSTLMKLDEKYRLCRQYILT